MFIIRIQNSCCQFLPDIFNEHRLEYTGANYFSLGKWKPVPTKVCSVEECVSKASLRGKPFDTIRFNIRYQGKVIKVS